MEMRHEDANYLSEANTMVQGESSLIEWYVPKFARWRGWSVRTKQLEMLMDPFAGATFRD